MAWYMRSVIEAQAVPVAADDDSFEINLEGSRTRRWGC